MMPASFLHQLTKIARKSTALTFTFFIKQALRTEYNGNIYRVFFIFDEGNVVVLFNGFQKKTQKTPSNEIKKALKIKDEYYADKQS